VKKSSSSEVAVGETAGEVSPSPATEMPDPVLSNRLISVEIFTGSFKAIEDCNQSDFFNAHMLAKERAALYMRSATFLLTTSDYYKRLSDTP
jgi:hypothetical protein